MIPNQHAQGGAHRTHLQVGGVGEQRARHAQAVLLAERAGEGRLARALLQQPHRARRVVRHQHAQGGTHSRLNDELSKSFGQI